MSFLNFNLLVHSVTIFNRRLEVTFTDGENHFAMVAVPLYHCRQVTQAELLHYLNDRAHGLLADRRVNDASRLEQVRHWRSRGACLGELFDRGYTAHEIVEGLGVMRLAHDLGLTT